MKRQMAELVVLNFKVADGKFDALADMFRDVLDDTHSYDECIKVDFYEDRGNSPITLVEEWETFAPAEISRMANRNGHPRGH